jgi:hypothetical protein
MRILKSKSVLSILLALINFQVLSGSLEAAYIEGFDNIGTITDNSDPLLWSWVNNSQNAGPALNNPSVGGWWQGDPTNTFFAQSGPTNSYARADFSSSSNFGNVFSNWYISPTFTFAAGDTFTFYTRTISNSAYPDRLQIRTSSNGTSINVGGDWSSVGDFTNLIGEINPTEQAGIYPETWTPFTYTVNSNFTGRIAFRYYVADTNVGGNYIGVDTFSTTANLYNAVPEPSTYALMLCGLGVLAVRNRMKLCRKAH